MRRHREETGFDGADEYMLTGCDGEAGQYFRFRVVPRNNIEPNAAAM